MSDKGTVSPKEKEATEKRGRGRPRKQTEEKTSDKSASVSSSSPEVGRQRPVMPTQEPSGSPTPKRPRGRPKGSKNKTSSKSKVSGRRRFHFLSPYLLIHVPTAAILRPVARHDTCFLPWGAPFALHFLSSRFLWLLVHSVVQVQRPQGCFQADTERPSHPYPAHSPSSSLAGVSIATADFSHPGLAAPLRALPLPLCTDRLREAYQKAAAAPSGGGKRRGRPKKEEKEETASQQSSEEEEEEDQ
ncbi:hypothetical protein D4764_08G0009330 [Takifugu flavidus]|uniref:High mobility group protein HMG-I/HMG-Y n=1 Tax=Takifugu flavidus TaxID=433684 RepID=A0A5C6MP87_9TELE|nr:hypothetical protein D4764_08G0009330 [Takifugu flavidus]